MKMNDIVPIYQKPLTGQDYEGDAVLVQLLRIDGNANARHVETWDVEFMDDRMECERTIEVLACGYPAHGMGYADTASIVAGLKKYEEAYSG